MAFTRMAFTPSTGLKNVDVFPATPVSEDAAREQFQRLLDQLKTAVNGLMAALENADTEVSGAAKMGSEPIANLEYGGVSPATIRGQVVALNEKIINAITNGLSISDALESNCIEDHMIQDGAVKAGKIYDDAVTESCIAPGAVLQENLGTIASITLDEND